MAYDNTWVPVVYNVLTAPQLQQMVDNIEWLHTQLTINGPDGSGLFVPNPIDCLWNSSNTMVANRIHITRIILHAPIKLNSFMAPGQGASPATRWGGGLYDTAGNLLVSGVTTQKTGSVVINPVPASSVLIPAGVYLMAMTGDANGIINVREAKVADQMSYMNAIVTTYGYTDTVSALGVLPASINTALTGVTNPAGPVAIWTLETTTY
jgi:hypothetical protein